MSLSPQLDGILRRSKALVGSISASTKSDDIRAMIAELQALEGSAQGPGASIAIRIIGDYVQAANNALRENEQNEILHVQEAQIKASTFRSDLMYDSLDRAGLLNNKEREYLAAIKDNETYSVTRFDKSGNPVGPEILISGAELRKDALLLKAFANKKELKEKDPEAVKRLNIELHGKADEPRDVAQQEAGKDKVIGAMVNVEGEAASRDPNPESKRARGRGLFSKIARFIRTGHLGTTEPLPDSPPVSVAHKSSHHRRHGLFHKMGGLLRRSRHSSGESHHDSAVENAADDATQQIAGARVTPSGTALSGNVGSANIEDASRVAEVVAAAVDDGNAPSSPIRLTAQDAVATNTTSQAPTIGTGGTGGRGGTAHV